MIKRKIIYIILIVLLVLVAFEKVGLYDSSYVKVDNFIIKRPFLYREIADKSSIILDKYSSTVILFTSVFTQNGVIYSFSKVTNKKKFEVESEYSLKIKKVDISYCYVLKKDIQLGAKIIKENNIYRYPYKLSFNEINGEREEEMIQQMCKNNKVIYLHKKN